jgi:pimeloyl-ACP methyl ester carboxylesterase
VSDDGGSGGLGARVRAWERAGRYETHGGERVFVAEVPGAGLPVVVVHGYPGSSFDWAGVLPHLGTRALAMDLLGFGLSDKPTGARYSLFDQADLVEAVLARAGITECLLVGHDMGTTVVAELLARSNAGRGAFAVPQVVLTNGSIFVDLARLTRGQRLALRLGGRATPFRLPPAFVRRSLRESIAPGTAVDGPALADLVALIRHRRGDRLLSRQIVYVQERRRHQDRWTSALVDFPGRLSALWGVRDPVAVVAMPRRLVQLRPATDVVLLDDVGHWPSIEAPDRIAAQIRDRLPDRAG